MCCSYTLRRKGDRRVSEFNNLRDTFRRLGMELTEEKETIYRGYMEDILELNESINLTAIRERDAFIAGHYDDSMACAFTPEFQEAGRIIDVGTGGGFPGIPLAIAYPDKEFVLVDSLNKRIKIIVSLAEKYGLSNVQALHGRAEELGRREGLREAFDLCVSRAVANMSTLTELCLPFVREGGSFIAYKGPGSDGEIADAAKAIEILGGSLRSVEKAYGGPEGTEHRLVIVSKKKKTPAKYPRKPGTPGKSPIK